MNTYGYVRVSTREQNEDRQLIAMRAFGVREDRIVLDRQSGKDFDRPGYQSLVRRLKAGDTLVIKSIDRLGRSYEEILEQWRLLTKEKQAAIRYGYSHGVCTNLTRFNGLDRIDNIAAHAIENWRNSH